MKEWFSAAELASLKLPDLPGTHRGVRRKMIREGWDDARQPNRLPARRRRKGRGGGSEYHVSLLPPAAFNDLERRELGFWRHILRQARRAIRRSAKR